MATEMANGSMTTDCYSDDRFVKNKLGFEKVRAAGQNRR